MLSEEKQRQLVRWSKCEPHQTNPTVMLVELKNVTISQQDGSEVLKNVDFKVDEGEFVYIIGRVGSGKSSLLKAIYFELDVDEADTATVLGADLMTLRRKHIPALRRQMGIIFQDFQLLSDHTVYKNLRFVLRATGWKKADVDDRIEEVLTLVGMKDKMLNMPHELSGGEQQRIAIARALLNSPKMIIADEPTGNLDPETAKNIMEILRQISHTGTAVIMTTHNMPLLEEYPGIVYRCENGKVEEISSDFNKLQVDGNEDTPISFVEKEGTIQFQEKDIPESNDMINHVEPSEEETKKTDNNEENDAPIELLEII